MCMIRSISVLRTCCELQCQRIDFWYPTPDFSIWRLNVEEKTSLVWRKKTELWAFQKEVLIYNSGTNDGYRRNADSIGLYLGCSTNKVSLINIKNRHSASREEEKILLRVALSQAQGHQLHAHVSFSPSHSSVLMDAALQMSWERCEEKVIKNDLVTCMMKMKTT